jgi:tetratricopeptide (TPR) repeat protein
VSGAHASARAGAERSIRSGTVGTLVLLLLGAVAPLTAQGRVGDPQSRALMEAATLESRGDLEGAETALLRALEIEPTSTGALFALERVLRAKNEVHELRPLVDAFLARVPDVEVRALRLQLLGEADSTRAMVAEAEAWLESDARAVVYSAVGGVYERILGPERALEVLRQGQARLGGNALALQTGDVQAAAGDMDGAADSWARSVAEDGSGMEAIRGRLQALGARRTDAARRLVGSLGDSALPERRRATLRLALEMGLQEEALELAERHAEGIGGRARVTFLNEIGILARESRMAAVAAWAYQALGETAASPEERRQFDQRIADISLEAGDTVSALDAQRRVVASFPGRSDEWRASLAETIKLEATAEPERVEESWAGFRADFPDAPELDAVAAQIAARLHARGDVEAATRALDGIEGPRSALERGYLLLGAGDIAGGRAMLLRGVGGLAPAEATPVIQFASLLGRLSDAGKAALATAGVTAHRGRPAEGASGLAEAAAGLGASDAAPLLAEAARLAESGGADGDATTYRRSLLDQHPEAPEVAEATLALARSARSAGIDPEEAIRMLEDLITRSPNAAVVPEARLELQRLRSRGS